MGTYAISLGLLSAALFGWVLGNEADEIASLDLLVFGCTLLLILSVQVLLLFLSDRLRQRFLRGHGEWLLRAVAAILVGCNAYFLAFMTLEQPVSIRVAWSALIAAIFFVIVSFRRARPILNVFAVLMVIMSLVQYVTTRMAFGDKDVTAETVSLPVKSKRNVYIIGTESLHSPDAYRENYGIENTEHVKVLEDGGFRVLNAFSADRQTLRSFSGIFEFVRAVQQDDFSWRSAFIYDNSAFRSFRDSGYGIQTVYNTNYFSVNRNRVDFVYPPVSFEACENMEPAFFYGMCRDKAVIFINKYVLRLPKKTVADAIEKLRERADVAATSSKPWLTWIHVHFPSHTSHYYRYPDPDYAAKYVKELKRDLPQVGDNMQRTAVYIAQKDPDAVIAVFGDHGTHFFRGIKKETIFTDKPVVPLNKALLDQNGVMLAVYPKDFCVDRIGDGFSTKALFENVIACLNGDDSPTDEERKRARTIRFLDEPRDLNELRTDKQD